ncbi:MAG: AAA family ATPase [Aestuariivirga sp.]
MNIVDQHRDRTAVPLQMPLGRTADTGSELDQAFSDISGALRRRAGTMLAVMALCVLAGLAYAATRQATYRATSMLLVDPARPNVLASQQVTELPLVDSGVVDSAAELIRSDYVAQGVVTRLGLGQDEEFTRASTLRRFLQPVLSMAGLQRQRSAEETDRAAASALQRRLDVRRIGVSYVVQVNFTSHDPEKSARIANTFVDVFLDSQINAKLDATRRAAKWLEQRTEELRAKVFAADEAVQSYRVQNNLIESDGKLLMDQEVMELTSQLSAIRASATEARVKAEKIGTLIAQNDFNSAAIEAPGDSPISKLRDQWIEQSREEKEVAERLGKNHRLAVDARLEMQAIQGQLEEEILKYRDSLIKAAISSENGVTKLEEETTKLSSRQLDLKEKSIRLREFERNATSLRQLYETFLSRQTEVIQQESLPAEDARVVAPATRPAMPSNTPLTLVLAGALGVGLLGGAATALLRDRLDNTVRRIEEAETLTSRRVLAIFEKVRGRSAAPLKRRLLSRANSSMGGHLPPHTGILRYVVEHPFSLFAEGFRHLRVALNPHSQGTWHVIGVITTLPGEGKTTIASNLGHYYSMTGAKTIVIDCDLRNPALSLQICPDEKRGVPDVLVGAVPWTELVKRDPVSKLSVLPGLTEIHVGNPAELLTLPSFGELITQVSQNYDTVIIDLAPLGSVFDARAVANWVDCFIYVIAWGETQRDAVERALANAPEVYEKVAGIIINRADGRQLKTMRSGYGGFDRYHTAYEPAG